MSHRMRVALAAPALAAVLALSACGGGSESPTPSPSASATPVTVKIPETRLTMSAPSTWEQQTKKDAFVLSARTASGTPSYVANIVVTTAPTDGMSLGDAGARTSEQAQRIDGWKADKDGQGGAVLAQSQSYRISGTYQSQGLRVAQEEHIIQVADAQGTGQLFVYITGSWAMGDDGAQKQVTTIIQSLAQPES